MISCRNLKLNNSCNTSGWLKGLVHLRWPLVFRSSSYALTNPSVTFTRRFCTTGLCGKKNHFKKMQLKLRFVSMLHKTHNATPDIKTSMQPDDSYFFPTIVPLRYTFKVPVLTLWKVVSMCNCWCKLFQALFNLIQQNLSWSFSWFCIRFKSGLELHT